MRCVSLLGSGEINNGRFDLQRKAGKLTGHPRGIGVLVDKLHVLHQQLAGHAELVADGTAARVGASHQGLVLQGKV